MSEADLVQVNVHLKPEQAALVDELAEEGGWSRRKTVLLALRALERMTDEERRSLAYTVEHEALLRRYLQRQEQAA